MLIDKIKKNIKLKNNKKNYSSQTKLTWQTHNPGLEIWYPTENKLKNIYEV
jgi:hypothetical protein